LGEKLSMRRIRIFLRQSMDVAEIHPSCQGMIIILLKDIGVKLFEFGVSE